MKLLTICLSLVLTLTSPIYTYAQKSKVRRNNVSVRMVKDRPSVYIDFLRKGRSQPLEEGESNERIWLRFVNNTRWDISFCASGVPEEYGEVGMYYEVVKMPYQESGTYSSEERKNEAKGKEKPEIPVGHRRGHVCHVYRLQSGRCVVFSVPREHLAEDLSIKVEFNYGWEKPDDVIEGLEPQHHVYFYSTKLPRQ